MEEDQLQGRHQALPSLGHAYCGSLEYTSTHGGTTHPAALPRSRYSRIAVALSCGHGSAL